MGESSTDEARIGYVVKVYPRFSETFVVTELLAREAAGERITVFALRASEDPRFHPELARVAAEVRYLPRPVKSSGLWEVLRESAATPSLTAGIARALPELLAADVDDAVQAIALAHRVQVEGITHLHAHFATSATTVARLASLLTQVPYSFTAHAKDIFHESVDAADLRRKAADAAYVATVSEFNVRHLRARMPEVADRVHLVRNGLELERFPFVPREPHAAPLRIAAVGRLVEKKGFDVLIDAVAALRDAGVHVEVDLAGGGELTDALQQQVRDLALDGVVRLLGPLPQDAIAALLRRADVFVAPCIVGADGNADGLPTVLLEAMASGVPCVSTAVTGIPEVVIDGETGILLEPGDVPALADAFRRIAEREVDALALARSARALVEGRFAAPLLAARHAELMQCASADELAVA
ncbi:MAG: glycosyltransferase [Actinomycetota bacterium]